MELISACVDGGYVFQKQSLKTQYEEEKNEAVEELAHVSDGTIASL